MQIEFEGDNFADVGDDNKVILLTHKQTTHTHTTHSHSHTIVHTDTQTKK